MASVPRSALVTGGASGLGRATAELLAANGFHVVAADLRPQPVAGVTPLACDVLDDRDVRAALDTAESFAPLRLVVHCAGVVGSPGRLIDLSGSALSLDRFRSIVEVNLVGTFNVLRLAAERMQHNPIVDEERGVVVTTASAEAFEAPTGHVAYATSKGGVASLTLHAARDLASRRIRVVSIAPGIFDTPILSQVHPESSRQVTNQVPHPHRLGRPGEFAALALHIASNPMLNGEVIRLDGALRIAP
ncbi:SDR family NAD(P)-dependent oxidoreductase [Amycolatopsis panacis]|uniref:SDR family NAD(P)-dependent oxidoreductase n=1 Tax=Amycolatopsis panacis TaxID=2340917 RepID=A0A419I1P5_9PSEU|nr:SDR family NAD(P)-dependent oxidoreductase [Amycolatopsis panacis]RJQ83674.1 SDR family NAD(P)-dependent oxidoreductase [Amycolatopsis panacis]